MKLILPLLTLALLATLGFVSPATPMPEAKPDVDIQSIAFEAKRINNGGGHRGRIAITKADFVRTKGGRIYKGYFSFNLNNMWIDDKQPMPEEMNQKLIKHLQGNQYFNVAKYGSKANLTINSIKGMTALGELTLAGATQPVSISLSKLQSTHSTYHIVGTAQIDLQAYGMNMHKSKVHNTVNISFDLEQQLEEEGVNY